jgi:hypothetical protein
MKETWIFLSILLILFSIYLYQCQYIYYKEYNQVGEEFKKIKGVKILNLGVGNYDLDLEEIYAVIRYEDKIDIGFSSSIHPSSFYGVKEFSIDEFGDWKIQSYECNHVFREDDYISSSNRLTSRDLNWKTQNIKDAILQYQEIGKIIDDIPEYPKFVEIQTEKDISTIYRYKYKKKLIKAPIFSGIRCDSLDKLLKSEQYKKSSN